MDRRDALKTVSLLLGYTMTGGAAAAILHGCKASTASDWTPVFLTADEEKLVMEICERILPKTETPGATDAQVVRYVDESVGVVFEPESQQHFRTGLLQFDQVSEKQFSKKFVALKPEQQETVLKALADESRNYVDPSGKKPHIFKTMKELTVSGYANSEVGAKGLFAYDPIPGTYQGCIDYASVGKAWAY